MTIFRRRDFLKYALAASAAVAVGGSSSPVIRALGRKETPLKLLILGFDGLDPRLLGRWMEEGKLPAFRRLIGQGGFRPLRTSLPPQSPVAWSNFITGTDPGDHGIFDFMHRDPRTYIPVFSASLATEARATVKLGKMVLPLRGGEVKNLLRGKAFWQVLEEYDIPATVFKMPANYPPLPTRQKTLSGMGTPDIKGSYGIFNFYTTRPMTINQTIGGGRIHQVYLIGNRIEARLPGPVNTFRKDRPEAEIDLKIFVDPVHPVAKIVLPDQEFLLKEREWSGWKRVHFDLIPTQKASGICMFYLKEIRPEFKLYVTPINIDPAEPVLPISTPPGYARELERVFGPFFTKGLPADTSALDHDILDEGEFLEMDDMILEEREKFFDFELARFDSGLLFYYVSSTDQRQHMFWRLHDETHPGFDPQLASLYGRTIENIYIAADRILDRAMQKSDKNTIILAMSDHGFNPFRRTFNLNTWLLENGYHRLRNPFRREEGELFANTDWSRTKAYAIGLNGLYINQRGREAEGIVDPGAESKNLIHEIAAKLDQVVDPLTGQRAVRRAFVAAEAYRGPHLENAPDIVVGFNEGYRVSWESPLGRFSRNVFDDNGEKWSGDHMGAPEIMPGILVANRKIVTEFPALYDITATILKVFGVPKPEEMIGEPVF